MNLSPLNTFKYCPFCGKPSLKSDDKKIYCNSCNFVYYINMNSAVAVVIYNNLDEILFTIRKNNPQIGKLDLPGGFVDLSETAEDAAKREISEELNLNISELTFLGTFANTYLYNNIEYKTLDIIFTAVADSFENIKANDDVLDYKFIKIENVNIDDLAFESIKNVVKLIKKNKNNTMQNTDNNTFVIEKENLIYKDLFPGEVLITIPENLLPQKIYIKTDKVLKDFKIEDSEQNIIAKADTVNIGEIELETFLKNYNPEMPTLNVSYLGDNVSNVTVKVICK